MTSGSDVSTSNVCSWPIDLAGVAVLDRVVVEAPRASGEATAHASRTAAPRRSGSSAARSPIVVTPNSRRAWARPLADAPQPGDGQRREEGRLGARRDDHQAVGLAQVGGDLGDELGRGHADRDRRGRAPSATSALDRAARSPRRPRTAPRMPVTSRNASSIEIGSTSGVKRRRIVMTSRLTAEYLAPSTGRKTAVGQSAARRPQRHRRVDAELARLVGGRADDAAVGRARRRRRSPACRAAPAGRAARRPRRTRPGRRGGSSGRAPLHPGRLARGVRAPGHPGAFAREPCPRSCNAPTACSGLAVALGLDHDRDLGRHARERP